MREMAPNQLGAYVLKLLNRDRELPSWLAVPAVLAIPFAKNLPCLIAGHNSVAESFSVPAMVVVVGPVFLLVALTQPRAKRWGLVQGAGLGLRILSVPLGAAALLSGDVVAALSCAGVFAEFWWLDRVVSRSGLAPEAQPA